MESEKNDLLEFLHEVIAARVENRMAATYQIPEFANLNERIKMYLTNIRDENIRDALMVYEDMKNENMAKIIPYLYTEAVKDMLYILRLIFTDFFKNSK